MPAVRRLDHPRVSREALDEARLAYRRVIGDRSPLVDHHPVAPVIEASHAGLTVSMAQNDGWYRNAKRGTEPKERGYAPEAI